MRLPSVPARRPTTTLLTLVCAACHDPGGGAPQGSTSTDAATSAGPDEGVPSTDAATSETSGHADSGDSGQLDPGDEIDALVAALADWPDAPDEYQTLEASEQVAEEEGGTMFACTNDTYSVRKNYEAIVALGDAYSQLKPGMLLQGRSVIEGQPVPVPALRGPATLYINLPLAEPTRTVDAPSSATLQAAIADLQNAASSEIGDVAAQVSYSVEQVDTFEQIATSTGVGLSYSGPLVSAGLSSSFSASRSLAAHSVVAKLVQPMYTIAFADDALPKASQFFADSTTPEDIEALLADGSLADDNLPVYVQSVTYGRIVLFTMTSETAASAENMALAVNAAFLGFGGSFEQQQEYQDVVASSEIDILALGASSADANAAIQTGDYSLLYGAADPAQAVPLSYKVVALESPRPVAVFGDATTYTVSDCAQYTWQTVHSGNHWACEHDAPGGSATGVNVETDDRLTISCGGAIWSGIAFWGTTPPGGTGNGAAGDFPMPGASEFGAIARIGGDGWFWVGPSYGPNSYTGAGGGLVLGVNDNVGNGNPCDHPEGSFDCQVTLERLLPP